MRDHDIDQTAKRTADTPRTTDATHQSAGLDPREPKGEAKDRGRQRREVKSEGDPDNPLICRGID